MSRQRQQTETLRCHHCTNHSNGFERGWLAHQAKRKGEETAGPIIYCPDCAERQLGDDPQFEVGEVSETRETLVQQPAARLI